MKYAAYVFLTLALHFPFDTPFALLPFIPESEVAEVQYLS